MRIVQAHVRHREPGGSEVFFENVVSLLRARGHEVVALQPDNRTIVGLRDRAGAAIQGIYSPRAERAMTEILDDAAADLVHLHNVYPLLSPSVVGACNAAGVPVVMSLQDYKLICPTAQYFRDGAPCRRCSGGNEHQCVLTNCRGNLLESAAYAVRTAVARRAGWFTRGVDRFIACSEFVKRRYVEEGFPPDRIEVIPNFADMPARRPGPSPGEYAAFVGRLSPEKGVSTLLEAAALSGVPLRVAGAGRGEPAVVPPNVQLVGSLARHELGDFLARARFLVVPSLFEEPFGIVAAEGMGQGLPVIASRTGGLAEVVDDGINGLLVPPGDVAALAERMARLWRSPELVARMGSAAREKATSEYHREIYCTRLERVYERLTNRAETTAEPVL